MKEFFGGEQSALEVRVGVITNGEKGDIINQYVTFTKIYTEQLKKHGRTREAIEETINICKDEDVLKEYLSSHEGEVHDIMFSLFDDEQILNATLRDYEKKGMEKGVKKGREEGILKTIRAMMSSLHLTAEQAINAANVPENERKAYISKLQSEA